MLSSEDKLLIDRYLDNSLTGIELRDFLNRLETDDVFKKYVSFHNKLVEGITEAEDKRLIHAVVEATGYRKRLVPLTVKLIITFLVITVAGITIWEYIGPGTSKERHKYFSWNFIRNKNSVPVQTEQPAEETRATEMKKEITKPEVRETDTVMQPETDTIPEDIVVKKDQLLITHQLQPIELAMSEHPKQESVGSDGESKIKDSYDVEFWVSPVNYKGYKLQGEKLILFGIELPDEVQLYSISETLWLKYGKDYFLLQSGDNFESLLESSTVPSILK